MNACERHQEDLTLLASGDLPPEEALRLEAHLAACPSCRRERESLARVVDALAPASRFAREAEVDWDRFAAATIARVERESAPRVLRFRERWTWRIQPAFALKAAGVFLAAGLVTLAVLRLPSGERSPAGEGARVEAVSTVISEDFQRRVEINLARQGTQRYLEESRSVLINVLDSPVRCAKDEVDIAAERQKSLELLRSKQLLRDALERPELARASQLCDQLEGVLTEISTLKDCADLERIRELRAAVQRNQLLVKIRVAEEGLGGGLA